MGRPDPAFEASTVYGPKKNHNAYNWVASAYSRATSEAVVVQPQHGYLINAATQLDEPIYQPNGSVNPLLLNGIVQCGVNGVPSGCMTGHLWNPAPRAGVTWDPQGNGKTAIRAGYGIFYEHGTSNEANTGSLEGSAPVVLSMEELNPGEFATGNAPNTRSYPPNVTSIPTHAVWPYVQQWSLSAERQLPTNTLVSLGYIGSKGTHLTLVRQLNQLLSTSNTINPFGTHDPLLTRTCEPTLRPGGGFDGSRNYDLPNGGIIRPQDPAYVNLEAVRQPRRRFCRWAPIRSMFATAGTAPTPARSLPACCPGDIRSAAGPTDARHHHYPEQQPRCLCSGNRHE